jgi:hypothetical protein
MAIYPHGKLRVAILYPNLLDHVKIPWGIRVRLWNRAFHSDGSAPVEVKLHPFWFWC